MEQGRIIFKLNQVGFAINSRWKVFLDGNEIGSIDFNNGLEVMASKGQHMVKYKVGAQSTKELVINVGEEDVIVTCVWDGSVSNFYATGSAAQYSQMPMGNYNNVNNSSLVYRKYIEEISAKMQTNGIIWCVIAGIQILVGVSYSSFMLIVGVLNLISAIDDLRSSKSFLSNPIGIVDKVKPVTGAVIALVYNLLIGGVIGCIGSIYYFLAIREYVMKNESIFLEIERQCGVSR